MSDSDLFLFLNLLGKPFRYGGRGPDCYDCYGLCIEVYRRRGIELPEHQSFADPALIHDGFDQGRSFIERLERPEPWCLVLFRVRPPFVSHIGMVLPNGYQFLHVMRGVRVCVERLDSPEWSHRVEGYYRYVGK